MPAKDFHQEFYGYYVDSKCFKPSIQDIPEESGVFIVYKGVELNEGVVDIDELLYVGSAENLNKEITSHDKLPIWNLLVGENYDLCFSITFTEVEFLEWVKAALINSVKPTLNCQYKESFPFDKTYLIIAGASYGIKDFIEVNKS